MSDSRSDSPSPGISPHLKERVRNFFRKGEHKLRFALAADLTDDEEDPATDEVCVLSQMAVEFFLKTFLLANKQQYRKLSHNVDLILMACAQLDPSFASLKEACTSLQNYRGVVEYELGEDGFPSVETAARCRRHACDIKKFVSEKLKLMGFDVPERDK